MLKKIEVIGFFFPNYPPANIIHCHLEHNLLLGTWLAWIKTPLNKQGWVRVRWLQKKTKLLCISSHLVISCDFKRNTWKFLKAWGESWSNLIQYFRVSLNVISDLKNSKCIMMDWGVPVYLPHNLLNFFLILHPVQPSLDVNTHMLSWSHGSQSSYYVFYKMQSFKEIQVSSFLESFSRVCGGRRGNLLHLQQCYEVKKAIASTHELKDEFCFKSFWYSHFYYIQVEY